MFRCQHDHAERCDRYEHFKSGECSNYDPDGKPRDPRRTYEELRYNSDQYRGRDYRPKDKYKRPMTPEEEQDLERKRRKRDRLVGRRYRKGSKNAPKDPDSSETPRDKTASKGSKHKKVGSNNMKNNDKKKNKKKKEKNTSKNRKASASETSESEEASDSDNEEDETPTSKKSKSKATTKKDQTSNNKSKSELSQTKRSDSEHRSVDKRSTADSKMSLQPTKNGSRTKSKSSKSAKDIKKSDTRSQSRSQKPESQSGSRKPEAKESKKSDPDYETKGRVIEEQSFDFNEEATQKNPKNKKDKKNKDKTDSDPETNLRTNKKESESQQVTRKEYLATRTKQEAGDKNESRKDNASNKSADKKSETHFYSSIQSMSQQGGGGDGKTDESSMISDVESNESGSSNPTKLAAERKKRTDEETMEYLMNQDPTEAGGSSKGSKNKRKGKSSKDFTTVTPTITPYKPNKP